MSDSMPVVKKPVEIKSTEYYKSNLYIERAEVIIIGEFLRDKNFSRGAWME